MTACMRGSGPGRGVPARLLALGLLLWLATPAFTQSIRIPDFREERAAVVSGPKMGEPCESCGVIRSIREVRNEQSIPVTSTAPADGFERARGAGVPIGAVIALPTGEGGTPYVGGVGTPEMRERFTQTTYEIAVRFDSGGVTTVQRRDGNRFRVGDRVRLRGVQMELLAN